MGDKRVVVPYASSPLSGQVTPATTGTPTALPDVQATRVALSALPLNSGTAWVGLQTGTPELANDSGFPLRSDGPILYLEGLSNLAVLYATTDVGGDGVSWILLHELDQFPIG